MLPRNFQLFRHISYAVLLSEGPVVCSNVGIACGKEKANGQVLQFPRGASQATASEIKKATDEAKSAKIQACSRTFSNTSMKKRQHDATTVFVGAISLQK
jgi:hypothetical protein